MLFKVNESVCIAKSRQWYEITLKQFLWCRPNHTLKILKSNPPSPPHPSPTIINFVISKSLFQNFDSNSIKTYAKFL